jgi:hypothetical protein
MTLPHTMLHVRKFQKHLMYLARKMSRLAIDTKGVLLI